MSLTSPTILDRFIDSLKRTVAAAKGFTQWRIVILGVALLIVFGAVLFTYDSCGTYYANRGNEKLKANINAALSNIAEKEQTVANLKTEIAVEKEGVKIETETLLKDTFTTDEKRVATNQALQALANAQNSVAVNSSVANLEKLLRELR